jgi:TonB-linked SusC/RagA family outer membrane protein
MKKKQTTKCWPVLLMLLLVCFHAMAQQKISGKVTDQVTGRPLAGVSVHVKGTAIHTLTDGEGLFAVTPALRQAVLVFSYVGYASQEIKTGDISTLNIALVGEKKDLDEVVVIGYGTVKKRDLTGAVASVKAADIVRSPTNNPLEAIQGMAPGADITRSSGKANAGVNILIRGTRTINGSSSPLYIIDGIQGGDPSSLNPNDIESIEVLKDASSTAIYGSQGANGVIIVTTKKGASGKARVSYNGYYGVDGWVQYPQPRLHDNYINLRREAYRTTGIWASPADDSKIFSSDEWNAIQAGQWVNWVDLLTQNGIRQSHSISISGGNDKTKAYFSGGYYKQDGLLKNNNLTQYNALLNVDQVISSWAKAGMQGALVYSNTNNRQSDPFSQAMIASPFGQPFDSAGNINLYPISGNPGILSPLSDDRGREIATNNTVQTRLTFNTHVDLELLKGLSFRTVFGANIVNSRNGQFFDASSLEQVNVKYSYAGVTNINSRFYNWDNILTYNTRFNDHALTLTALTSYTNRTQETYTGSGTNLVYSSQLFYNLGGTATNNRTLYSNYVGTANMSYAGRINYSYKGRYLFTFTERLDGASLLSVGHKWAGFPSAAFAWRMSDERFMKEVQAVSNLKLRVSYGVAGNSGISPYGTQSYLVNQNMGFENVPAQAYIFNATIGNTSLGWELSKTANIGLDLSLFKNRVNATIDVYNTNTSDILLLRSLPPDQGVSSIYQNVGSSRNRGIEISLNTRTIERRNFRWNTQFTFTSNREKITGLINGTNIIDAQSPETNSLLIGRPIRSFYNYRKLGIWQNGEADKAAALNFGGTPFKPGDIKLEDINHDNKISPDSDRVYIGAAVPKWSAGFQNTFQYKGFDLTIYVLARWGQMIKADFLGRYNPAGEGNNGPDYFNYWTPENPSNDYPRPKQNTSLTAYPGSTTLNYVDGSYIKIKNIVLGYTFSPSVTRKMKIDHLRAYVTCNNIAFIAKSHLVKYYDPERGGAEDSPLTRQLVFGLNVGF